MTLKVVSSTEGDSVVLNLSGRIRKEQICELAAVFNSASRGRSIILDLTDVRLVDLGTVQFLEQLETKGAQLRNCPAYIREWISRERIGNSNH